jgi:hypothetical protein
MKTLRNAALVLLATLVPAPDAQAEWISYQFQGFVPASPFPVTIYGAEPITGTLSYDTNAVTAVGVGNLATDFTTSASLTVQVGRQTYSSDPARPFEVEFSNTAITFMQHGVDSNISFHLENTQIPLFSSIDALPDHLSMAAPGSLANVSVSALFPYSLEGTITSLSQLPSAPEPGAVLLGAWGAGLALLALRRRPWARG